MNPELAARAASQWGLFSRRQAVEAGYRGPAIRGLTAPGGDWVVVRRGVYMDRTAWESLDEYVGKPLARDRAVHLSLRVGHVMSHDSAARAWGLALLRPARELVHVTRPGVLGSRTEHGIKHHLARCDPGQMAVDGLDVTSLARTTIDLGREHGFAAGVVACDSAMRLGVTRAELEDALQLMRSWAGVTRPRAAVEVADPGAETAGESLMGILLRELGFGPVETQFPVRTDGGVVWCDARIGCHMFEFDGRKKYLDRALGGVADRAATEVVLDERKRQLLVCAKGVGMSRVDWSDMWGSQRVEAKDRLRAEWAVSVRRFGTELPPEMKAFAEAMRDERERRIMRDRLPDSA